MQPDMWAVSDFGLRDAIFRAWAQLPSDLQRALAGVKFVQKSSLAGNALASAGRDDIWVRSELKAAQMACLDAVILHEIGHVACRHFDRIQAGQITPQQAEREADEWIRAIGFGDALERRAWLLGR